MTVYVVTEHDYEGSYVVGVYRERADAEAVAAAFNAKSAADRGTADRDVSEQEVIETMVEAASK